jgi:hypothetical protein
MKYVIIFLLGGMLGGLVGWFFTAANYSAQLNAVYLTRKGISVNRDMLLMYSRVPKVDLDNSLGEALRERLCGDIAFLRRVNSGTLDWDLYPGANPLMRKVASESAAHFLDVPYGIGADKYFENECKPL